MFTTEFKHRIICSAARALAHFNCYKRIDGVISISTKSSIKQTFILHNDYYILILIFSDLTEVTLAGGVTLDSFVKVLINA